LFHKGITYKTSFDSKQPKPHGEKRTYRNVHNTELFIKGYEFFVVLYVKLLQAIIIEFFRKSV
jgi:hypothetical protein